MYLLAMLQLSLRELDLKDLQILEREPLRFCERV